MSLMLLAVSTCLVKALKGKTLAGDRVLESDPTALRFTESGASTDQVGPFISIFAHKGKAVGAGQETPLLANGDCEIELVTGVTASMTGVVDDDGVGGKFTFIDLAPTSANMDRALNLMHRQMVDALLGQTFWASLFRTLAIVSGVDRAGVVSAEDGQRLAARQVIVKSSVMDDPASEDIDAYQEWLGAGDEAAELPPDAPPFSQFLWGLHVSGDPDDREMADEITALMSGEELDWQAFAKTLGFTADQMAVLGLMPFDPDNPELVATGSDVTLSKPSAGE